jgi:hypothetical protein
MKTKSLSAFTWVLAISPIFCFHRPFPWVFFPGWERGVSRIRNSIGNGGLIWLEYRFAQRPSSTSLTYTYHMFGDLTDADVKPADRLPLTPSPSSGISLTCRFEEHAPAAGVSYLVCARQADRQPSSADFCRR